jgi:hypothetical protein
MANVAGFLSTTNAQPTDLVGEWQETVLIRNAKGFNTGSTLFGLMSRLKSEPADNITYNWWERNPAILSIYSSVANSDTTTGAALVLDFDDGSPASPSQSATSENDSGAWNVYNLLNQYGILENYRTGERVRLTLDPTSHMVAVQRGIQGTSAVAVLKGDLWTIITKAKDEGAGPSRSNYQNPDSYSNYIQTFNTSVLLTNAYKAGVLRTDIEGPLRERRGYALERIACDIELAYFFGVAEAATGTNGNIYYTGGIKNAVDAAGLTANALNGNGAAGVTLDAFKAWIASYMTVGSDTKLGFCGPAAYAAISNYANTAAGGFRIMNQETVFGMAITNIITPNGELSLAQHPLFKNSVAHNGFMAVIDLQLVAQKVMEPLFLETNIQPPGTAAYQEQFRAGYGLKQKFPEAFGYAKNLQLITAT